MKRWKKIVPATLTICLLVSFAAPAAAPGTRTGQDYSGQVSQEAPSGGLGNSAQSGGTGPYAGAADSGQVSQEAPSTGQGTGQVSTEAPSASQGSAGQSSGPDVSSAGGSTGQSSGPDVPSSGGSTGQSSGPDVPSAGGSTGQPSGPDVSSAGGSTGQSSGPDVSSVGGSTGQLVGPDVSSSNGSTGRPMGSDGSSVGGNNTSGFLDSSSGSSTTNQTGTAVSQGAASDVSGTLPAKPEIAAEGAVVIDAATGRILYGKNETSRFYPASTTKLMTALLVLERTNPGDMVTFSKTATTNLESGASTLNLTEGDRLTVEQCLYGLLLKSANEIGNALAEHVSGSVENFAQLMNQRAAELGCTGTHFANPHGLNDNNHYTTPYDMALIGRAAFQNQTLCKIDTTLSYQFPTTLKEESKTITMGHKMMYPSDSRYYEGIIGGKTGYTSIAGNTLVTGVQRGGVRLVAVVMKSKATHYTDTKKLLDYGFQIMKQTAASPASGWEKDSRGWYYILANGTKAAGQWLRVDQTDYWIDPDGYMATGWRQFDGGAWYYFRSSGAKAVNYWVEDNGKWFYLGEEGVMLKNTRTPDGYQLGADGAWIQ